ncbi:MAG TPA: SGNH/GDSL hydrolase family protein [Tepidisphaeraceae bacterium]|jgi:lysophospholipase L1-like esterase|nr:SGNH/GDSL hydrolase family protein [Tepidisphaeraceae bacterium]
MRLTGIAVLLTIASLAWPVVCRADDAKLQPNDFLAIVGDSITEQRIYSVDMEDYLLMCKPVEPIRVMQFGWGGETSWGLFARLDNDVLRFKPTAATTFYGMNDGAYSPQDPVKHKHYYDNQTAIVAAMKKAGVRLIVVGAPDPVDTFSFRRNPKAAEMYNKTLADERDVCKQVADEQHVQYADVYDNMMDVMQKAKAKYGNDYLVCGGDGVHPGPNGHLVIAYSFLKALGCDGDIGAITFDMAADSATATDGHKILSAKNGVVQVESTRYPYCFTGNPKSPDATTGIIEFFPFNQDLNRFTLVVTNAKSPKLKVTWGKTSKVFSSDELAKGINLAAEFLDNPFSAQFAKVDQAVRAQQDFETPLIKGLIHDLPGFEQMVPEDKDQLEKFAADAAAKDQSLAAAAAAAVTPVQYTITIEAAQ